MHAREFLQHRIQLGLRLLRRDTILQTAETLYKMRAAVVRVGAEGERPPDVHGIAVCQRVVRIAGMLHAGRHYADDRERPRIEHDLPAEDILRGAEPRAPHAIAQDHLESVAGKLVVGRELPPASGPQSQHLKESGGHAKCGELHRIACAGKLQIGVGVRGEAFKGFGARAKIAQVEVVHGKLGEALILIEDAYDAAGIGVGERAQEHAVNHAEDGGIGADAQRDGENNDGGEAGTFGERARAVAQVAEENFGVHELRLLPANTERQAHGCSQREAGRGVNSGDGRLAGQLRFEVVLRLPVAAVGQIVQGEVELHAAADAARDPQVEDGVPARHDRRRPRHPGGSG